MLTEFVVETRYCFKLFNLFYIRDWSLVMGRGGGTTKWENRGSVTFCARPPVWLKLQAPVFKLPQNLL